MDTTPTSSLREASVAPADWFEALPEEHRERILAEDGAQLDHWAELDSKRLRAWITPVRQGALLFASLGFFVSIFEPSAGVSGILFGGLTGWIWHRYQLGQILSAVLAVPLFFLGMAVSGNCNFFAIAWAPFPIIVVSMFLGMKRDELPGS